MRGSQDLENLSVTMVRSDLDDIPRFPLPAPFRIRCYEPGDETHWLSIHGAADKRNAITPGLFRGQFGSDDGLLSQRQFYLCDGDGLAIGTATAWFKDDYRGLPWGRVHWVAIVPAMQGKGLAKPLMTLVCERLRELGHVRAYLSTSTLRVPAISLYLKFGFVPEIKDEQAREAWRALRCVAGCEALRAADLGALRPHR